MCAPPPWSQDEHDLSEMRARLHEPVRLGSLLEWKARVHDGADRAFGDGRPERGLDPFTQDALLLRPARAQSGASDDEALAHDLAKVEFHLRALGGGDVDEAAALREQLY